MIRLFSLVVVLVILCCWRPVAGEQVRGKHVKRKIVDNAEQKTVETPTGDLFVQDEEDIASPLLPATTTRRWVINGVSLVQARCQECQGDLHAEQDYILDSLQQSFGKTNVQLIYREDYLVNVQFVDIKTTMTGDATPTTDADSTAAVQTTILNIHGVRHASLSRDLQLQQPQAQPQPHERSPITTFDVADDYVKAAAARQEYCVTGRGLRVAVLDTGVDYTHHLFGGPGTRQAFAHAYGQNAASTANTRRDGLFPTPRVVEGYDFVGEGVGVASSNGNHTPTAVLDIKMDNDPIDYPGGHGTRVASCILAVAPDVELLAVKVCSVGGCPEFSVLAGIRFAMEHGAQIINCTYCIGRVVHLCMLVLGKTPSLGTFQFSDTTQYPWEHRT